MTLQPASSAGVDRDAGRSLTTSATLNPFQFLSKAETTTVACDNCPVPAQNSNTPSDRFTIAEILLINLLKQKTPFEPCSFRFEIKAITADNTIGLDINRMNWTGELGNVHEAFHAAAEKYILSFITTFEKALPRLISDNKKEESETEFRKQLSDIEKNVKALITGASKHTQKTIEKSTQKIEAPYQNDAVVKYLNDVKVCLEKSTLYSVPLNTCFQNILAVSNRLITNRNSK